MFISQSNSVDKALCLAPVDFMLGEDIVIALEQLDQHLPSSLASQTRSYVNWDLAVSVRSPKRWLMSGARLELTYQSGRALEQLKIFQT